MGRDIESHQGIFRVVGFKKIDTYIIFTFKNNIFLSFSEKRKFYSLALAASLQLGREAWESTDKQIGDGYRKLLQN
jgi:hypothetical protein